MTDYVEHIKAGNNTWDIGGNFIDDEWTLKNYTVVQGLDMAGSMFDSSGSYAFTISAYLKDEVGLYELLGYIEYDRTPSDTDQPLVFVRDGTTKQFPCPVSSPVLQTTVSYEHTAGAFRTVINHTNVASNEFKLGLYNSRLQDLTGVSIYLRGYRRIGTNE